MGDIIRSIVICGSAKFIEEISVLAIKLRRKMYIVTELKDVPYPSTREPIEKLANKKFYFDKIKKSDLVLIYNEYGYIGLSTAMELQFSLDDNRKRPIRFLYIPDKDIIECRALLRSTNYNIKVDSRWLH